MKYVSLDLETTGVFRNEPDQHKIDNVLQLSMVVEDTDAWKPLDELPQFTCFIQHNHLAGEPYAMAMNAWIINWLSGYQCKNETPPYPILSEQDAVVQAAAFLAEHFPGNQQDINVCGKNVVFDLKFLPTRLTQRMRHRLLDAGGLWVRKDDKAVPGTADLAKRAGIEQGDHDAYYDNLFNISAVRRKWGIPLHKADEPVPEAPETAARELYAALGVAFGGINPNLQLVVADVAKVLAKYQGKL